MIYKIMKILYDWTTTPVLHLNLMQIFIALSEFATICWIVTGAHYIVDKIREKIKKK